METVEIFRPIKNYEGIYEVSNYGKVKSLSRPIPNKWGNQERILKPRINDNGYYYVGLSKNNKVKSYKVHCLVWDMFGDESRNGQILQIDHKDGNKLNDYIGNLQLLTQRQNTSKGYLNKKRSGLPTGVFKNKGRFRAQICIKGKYRFLGNFFSAEQASQAYQNALMLL